MTFRDRLAAIYSPTRRLANPEQEVLTQGGAFGGVEWVVPRAACMFRRMDFSAVDAKRRSAAATLAAQRLYPTAQACHALSWLGSMAHIWVWIEPDRAVLESGRWLPETALLVPATDQQPRLLQLAQGFEGQFWTNDGLVASQWWPQVPDSFQWQRFLRAAGLAVTHDDAAPEAQALPWQLRPWGDGAGRLPWSAAALERTAWLLAGIILAVGLGWQLAAFSAWQISYIRLESRLEALRQQALPLLEARERAEAALSQLDGYVQLQHNISDYALMAQVISPLPNDVRVLEWQREGQRLRASVSSAQADPRKFVAAYQGDALLGEVSASPGAAGRMGLDFTLPSAKTDAQEAP